MKNELTSENEQEETKNIKNDHDQDSNNYAVALSDPNVAPLNTGMQLTLDIFKDLGQRGIEIEQSEKEIGFRKNNSLITVRPLTLHQKRMLDVIFFIIAQGIDNTSTANYFDFIKKTKEGHYEIDLNFFKWLLSYKDASNSRIRDILSSIQDVRIQAEELTLEEDSDYNAKDRLRHWQTHNFFNSAVIDVTNHKAAFSINPLFEQHITQPALFHFLSLRYIFPTLASKVLYDWVVSLPVQKQPINISFKDLLKELNLEKRKSYREFGEFNRSFLQPAIKVINTRTNLHITVEFFRNNPKKPRTITDLAFTVDLNEYLIQDKRNDNLLFMEQYRTLRNKIGLSDSQVEEIVRERGAYDDERIEQAIKYTLVQQRLGKIKHSLSGYFMTALREGYRIGEIELQQHLSADPRLRELIGEVIYSGRGVSRQQERAAVPLSADERIIAEKEKSKSGFEYYRTKLTDEEKLAYLDEFLNNPYIQFVAKALDLDPFDKGAMFQAVFSNERLSHEFGLYMAEKA